MNIISMISRAAIKKGATRASKDEPITVTCSPVATTWLPGAGSLHDIEL